MKIVFVYWSLGLGGVERMMTTMMKYFIEKRDDVSFIHVGPCIDKTVPTGLVDVPFRYLGANSFGSAVIRLAMVLGSIRPDLVYTAMPTLNIMVILARLLTIRKFPVVISERSDPGGEYDIGHSWRYKLAIRLAPYFYPLADHIVCVSAGLAERVKETIPVSPSRISVIYNPVVDERPRSAREGPPHPWLEVRRTFPVVVTAGRIAKEKDFPTLLAAIAQLQNRRPVRLIILGDGVDAPNLRNQIANLGLSQRVFLAGTVQDIRPWLQYCDLFALSSQYEGFGNVLVEALAEGCRIVSTDCPFGPREILKGGKFGKLVPVGDIDALAHAIECYLCTAVDQEALRNRSLDFTIEKSMKAYNQLFEQLVYYSVSKSRHSQK